jgi:hypothetical protein
VAVTAKYNTLTGLNMSMIANKRARAAIAKRAQFLDLLRAGNSVVMACEKLPISYSLYKQWRTRDEGFRVEASAIIASRKALKFGSSIEGDEDLAVFAQKYFGHTYASFHHRAIDAMKNTTPGGITVVMFPPEHGKTTLFEDWTNHKLAFDPTWRTIVLAEGSSISRKILGRVKNRMEPLGPTPAYVNTYGPFAPQTGEMARANQPWGADYFSVWRKPSFDERDYSVNALGAGSAIISARTDHLHLDDIQSRKSLQKTDLLEDLFHQDWLTRPGSRGITTIFGTPAGEDDFLARIEAKRDDLGKLMKIIKLPAIVHNELTGEEEPLWKEMYSLDDLDGMRRKIGEDVWNLTYMMSRSVPSSRRTFSDDTIDAMLDRELTVKDRMEGAVCYLTLDPGLGTGKNVVMCIEVHPTGRLIVRYTKEKVGLQRNEEIMNEVQFVVDRTRQLGARVSDLRIESMNFQKGLARDERLVDMCRREGIQVNEHLTGINKYDEAIGVPSMASSCIKREILIPYADDPETRAQGDELIRQLKAWKPYHRGKSLRQDRVMTLWFGWILWQWRHKTVPLPASGAPEMFRRQGLPFSPTKTGLLIPMGARA